MTHHYIETVNGELEHFDFPLSNYYVMKQALKQNQHNNMYITRWFTGVEKYKVVWAREWRTRAMLYNQWNDY